MLRQRFLRRLEASPPEPRRGAQIKKEKIINTGQAMGK